MTGKKLVKDRYTFGVWNRLFFSNINTRLAMPWTRLFIALRLKPNHVTILSFLISLVGMACIALPALGWIEPFAWNHAWGAFFLMMGIWWDHSDGQVARATGQGSMIGGLFDTVLDRWIETGWLLALGIALYTTPPAQATLYEPWIIVTVIAASIFGNLYLRWCNIQKDLYVLRNELLRVKKEGMEAMKQAAHAQAAKGKPDVRMLYIPFAFNRDVTFWMLAVITLTPYWIEGLAIFAALHIIRGVEKNYYTMRALQQGDPQALANFLDPDYHK